MARQVTLDALMERAPLHIQPVRVESSLPAGFRVEWLSGEGNGLTFDLTAGAGVGSAYLILTIEHPEHGLIEEVVDIRPVVAQWVEDAVAAGATPKVEE